MVAATSTTTTTTTATTNPHQQNHINKTSSHHQQQQQNSHTQNQNSTSRRPPLEKDQNGVNPRRPRGRQVSSRYLSPSPSTSSSNSSSTTTTTATMTSNSTTPSVKRFASPLISRTTNTLSPFSSTKRSQSVDRRRPSTASTPRPSLAEAKSTEAKPTELSAATKMLITSTRSLSVSFQGEAFSLPISKTKPTTNTSPAVAAARKATPERRRPTPAENAKPSDQHRWPARTRQGNSSVNNSLTQSMDISSNDKKKLIGFGSGTIVKALQQSVINERRLSLDLGNAELLKDERDDKHNNRDGNLLGNGSCVSGDLTSAASDTDSVSSGSTSEVQEGRPKSGPRNIVLSARFWQETNSRLRRLQDPGSPLSTSPGSRISAPSKFSQSKRFSSDGSVASPRMTASPIRGGTRPASPSKLWTSSSASSPLRGLSPSRVRSAIGGALSGNSGNATNSPSILSFSVDVRRGKMGEERIVDAHMLRLLYNRYLQWRFVNARADATFMVQRLNAEKNLWNAWVTISELRHSVTLKRIKLLLLRQKLKLTAILKGQIVYLEEWSLLDRDHSNSLLGATEALKASTLRLPVVGKAVADIQNLKDAVGSAVDVMQAMASSICSLLSKVEEMNTLVAELANITEKEKVMLEQCKDFLSMLAAMQVKDCSLRTHIIQLKRVPTTSSLTARV